MGMLTFCTPYSEKKGRHLYEKSYFTYGRPLRSEYKTLSFVDAEDFVKHMFVLGEINQQELEDEIEFIVKKINKNDEDLAYARTGMDLR